MTAFPGAPARRTRLPARLRRAVLMLGLAVACAAVATPAQATPALARGAGMTASGMTASGMTASGMTASGMTASGMTASGTTASGTTASGTTASGPAAAQPAPADAASSATVIAKAVKAQAASCVAPPLSPGAHSDAVTYLQLLLNVGGYWQGAVNGSYGELTRQAVMALQAAHGLYVDGVMGPDAWVALCSTGRPVPRSRSGLVLEVDKRRQLLLVARDGKTIWVLHTSTGGNYWYDNGRSVANTPEGRFSVYVRVDGWQHEPLGALYRPAFVVGGVAVHGGYAVPPYPASHGCIRQTNQAMDMLWAGGFLDIGTNVWIYS